MGVRVVFSRVVNETYFPVYVRSLYNANVVLVPLQTFGSNFPFSYRSTKRLKRKIPGFSVHENSLSSVRFSRNPNTAQDGDGKWGKQRITRFFRWTELIRQFLSLCLSPATNERTDGQGLKQNSGKKVGGMQKKMGGTKKWVGCRKKRRDGVQKTGIYYRGRGGGYDTSLAKSSNKLVRKILE